METSRGWFVYLLRCSDGSLYCGSTNDPERRLRQHNSGKGSKFVRSRLPAILVYLESHPDRSSACKRESEIKKFPRSDKLHLIQGFTGDIP